MKRQKCRGLLATFLVLVVLMVGCGKESQKTLVDEEKTNIEESIEGEATEKTEEVVKEFFPHITEDGKIEIDSLFQFTGFNPDCSDEEGTDIAALHVKNISNEHLTEAEIAIKLKDGQNIMFVAKELPSQQSMMVFSKDNISYDGTTLFDAISVDAIFENNDTLLSDKLRVSVEEMVITITNISDESLTDLVVKCHCMLEMDSFGGRTYDYLVDSIAPGESVSVEAYECYLGSALVVKIEEGN